MEKITVDVEPRLLPEAATAQLERIAAALETIAAALSATLSDDQAAADTHTPDNGDGDAWRPRNGRGAIFAGDPVIVDRLFESEGVTAATVVFESGSTLTIWASALSEPPA